MDIDFISLIQSSNTGIPTEFRICVSGALHKRETQEQGCYLRKDRKLLMANGNLSDILFCFHRRYQNKDTISLLSSQEARSLLSNKKNGAEKKAPACREPHGDDKVIQGWLESMMDSLEPASSDLRLVTSVATCLETWTGKDGIQSEGQKPGWNCSDFPFIAVPVQKIVFRAGKRKLNCLRQDTRSRFLILYPPST